MKQLICTCNVSIIGDFPGIISNSQASGIIGLTNDYARAIGCSTNADVLTGKSGGIYASNNKGIYAENCHFVGELIGLDTSDKAGGIAGEGIRKNSETIDDKLVFTRNILKNCSSRCKNINGNGGGIVGGTSRECDISNCSVEVIDLDDNINGGLISKKGAYGGGIAGYSFKDSVIDSCYVKCNKLYGTRCGGIIGGSNSHNNVVKNSYVITQNGIDEHSQQSGGIIGGYSNNNTVENCYFIGDIHAKYSGGILGNNSLYDIDTEANIKNVYVVGTLGHNSRDSYGTNGTNGTINNDGFIAESSSSGHIVEKGKLEKTWTNSSSTNILKSIDIITDGSSPDSDTIFIRGEPNTNDIPYRLSWEQTLSFSDSDTVKNIFAGFISTEDYTYESVTSEPKDVNIDYKVSITLSNISLSDISSDQQSNLIKALKNAYASFYQRQESKIIVTLTEGTVMATIYVNNSLISVSLLNSHESTANEDSGFEYIAHNEDGTNETEYVGGIAISSQGHTFMCGYTDGDWIGYNILDKQIFLIFVYKFRPDLNKSWYNQIYSMRTATTANHDRAVDIAVDSNDDAIICGYTYGEFDGTIEQFTGDVGHHWGTSDQKNPSGNANLIVAKFDGIHGSVLWLKQIVPHFGRGYNLAIDSNDNIFVSSLLQPGGEGASKPTIIKFDGTNGNELSRIEISPFFVPNTIAIDTNDNVIVAGHEVVMYSGRLKHRGMIIMGVVTHM